MSSAESAPAQPASPAGNTNSNTNGTSAQPAAQSNNATTSPGPSPTTAVDNLQCQWKGCGERATSPEALYEHVCERHVGRKSTNNLCLVCSWGNCSTSTVKRDHITSHIRVHVPLKPHKCDFCGKSFKRPQDLKKHVKTHADDSVIMRSPHDGAGGARTHTNGYGAPMGGPTRPTGFYPDGGMPGGVSMGYPYQTTQGTAGYYAPTAAPVAAGGHYGQVYYNVANPVADGIHAGYDGRRADGITHMNNFFGAIKSRQFDTSNYGSFSQHLMALQNLQLPLPVHNGGGMGDYGVAHGGAHGGVYGPTAHHAHNLPSLSNLRTKADLSFLDEQLTQMTQAAYEAQSAMTGSGVSQGYPIPTGLGMRHSNSPPAVHPHSGHANAVASAQSTPPALTPGSSAMSYTSGHSPTSVHSTMVSPSTTGANYPTLPGGTSSPTSGMAPTSALGGQYDQDRRRYSGGLLQRSQPAPETRPTDEMEVDTPAATSSKKHSKTRDANIDPALAGSPTSASGSSDGTATPTATASDEWVHHMRLLEQLSAFVKDKLERREYDEDDEEKETSETKSEPMDTEREGSSDNLYPKLST